MLYTVANGTKVYLMRCRPKGVKSYIKSIIFFVLGENRDCRLLLPRGWQTAASFYLKSTLEFTHLCITYSLSPWIGPYTAQGTSQQSVYSTLQMYAKWNRFITIAFGECEKLISDPTCASAKVGLSGSEWSNCSLILWNLVSGCNWWSQFPKYWLERCWAT